MLGFFYSLLLKLFYPTSISILMLLASAYFRWRANRSRVASGAGTPTSDHRPLTAQRFARACFWSGLAVLFICGNGWVVGAMTRHLERQYPPLTSDLPLLTSGQGGSAADAILVLSGGIYDSTPPRPTVEVGEAGDRLLYGAFLFRKGVAQQIICTGNVATGGLARRALAEQMQDFLSMIGIPTNSMLTEIKSENTHQHAVQLAPIFRDRGFRRILVVTSAMHMPRSMAVFRKQCPEVEFIPAPTDFQAVDPMPMPWYRHLTALVPTPRTLLAFCEVSHEYLGLAYYKLRGWAR